jgi:hypothetical protein
MVFGQLERIQSAPQPFHNQQSGSAKVIRIPLVKVLLVLALVGTGISVLADDEFARALEPSNLLLAVSGSDTGIFPMSLDAGSTSVVTYDLAEGRVKYTVGSALTPTYVDPVFCFNLDEASDGGLKVDAKDVNGHTIVDGMALNSSLVYDLDLETISMQASTAAQCFFKGEAGDFGLFGVAPSNGQTVEDDGDRMFVDKFEANVQLKVEFNDVPQWASSLSTVSYSITVTNTGDADIDRFGFQEVFPANSAIFDAWFADSGYSCSDSANGSHCADAATGDGASIRGESLKLPKGESLTFVVTRFIPSSVILGGEIHLYAAAGGRNGTIPVFDTAEAVITIVGVGETLSATTSGAVANGEDEAEIVITALDADQNPVPGVEITLLEDDGLAILPTQVTTDESTGEAHFYATTTVADEYWVTFDAEGMDPVDTTISFSAGAPAMVFAETTVNNAVADGSDTVEFTISVEDAFENPVPTQLVAVSDDGGLSSITDADAFTDSNGQAVIQASSTTATDYTVEFVADGLTDTASATFIAGSPAQLAFVVEPSDTIAGDVIDPAVVLQVLDASGNLVTHDNSTEVSLILRKDGSTVAFLDEQVVANGEVEFAGLVMEYGLGENYRIRATSDPATTTVNSETFAILPLP